MAHAAYAYIIVMICTRTRACTAVISLVEVFIGRTYAKVCGLLCMVHGDKVTMK